MGTKWRTSFHPEKTWISHKVEIYPDENAKEVLDLNFHYQRYLYNLGIERYNLCKKECLEIGEFFHMVGKFFFGSFLQSPRRIKKEFEKDERIIGKVRESAATALTAAYYNWFENKEAFGEPHYHKRGYCSNSFTLRPMKTPSGYDTRIEGNELIFPKLIRGFKKSKVIGHCVLSEKPRFNGRILNVTFSEYAGHYYASFTFMMDKSPYPKTKTNRKIGIDLGVKTFITAATSDRRKIIIENQDKMNKLIGLRKRVRFYQSKMDKSYYVNKKKTKNYWRWNYKFRQTWKKICDIKRDLLHKISTYLTITFSTIKIEDLHVHELLMKNKKIKRSLNQDISYGCFRMFRDMLEYKSKLRGVTLELVDQFFPSSQICCRCGNKKPMPLKMRVYECPICKLSIDRDLNAAINILKETERVSILVGSQV